MATLASSQSFATCLVSSFLRSSVGCGKARRMTLPSFCGVSPMSEARIAFSMFFIVDASQGEITSVRGSGTWMAAICMIGVGVP